MFKSKEAEFQKYLKILGNTIRKLREDKNISQEKLGFAAGIHRTYVSDIELGNRNPSIKTLFFISNALNVKLVDLINND